MSHGSESRPLRISVEEAKERYDENEVTVLDVVKPETYQQLSQQIADAVRVNPEGAADELDRVPKDHTVLTY